MATAAFTVTPNWQKAADGPLSVLVAAIDGFYFAVTPGPAPSVNKELCPYRKRGDELSVELVSGESLYIAGYRAFETTVTTGA